LRNWLWNIIIMGIISWSGYFIRKYLFKIVLTIRRKYFKLTNNISFNIVAWYAKLSFLIFHSLSRFRRAIFRTIFHWASCTAEICSIYHKYSLGWQYRNTWPPFSAFRSPVPISLAFFSVAPRMSPKKRKCNAFPPLLPHWKWNWAMQQQWNVCNAWDEMKCNTRWGQKKRLDKNENWKSGERKAKKRKQNSRPGKKNFKHGANIMSCVLARLPSLSLRISLQLLLGKSNIDLWRVRMSGRQKNV